MTRSSKPEPTSSPSYVPATDAEKEEAFRLAAELFNLVTADLAKDSSLNKPAEPSTRKRS